jgi:predicted esterase
MPKQGDPTRPGEGGRKRARRVVGVAVAAIALVGVAPAGAARAASPVGAPPKLAGMPSGAPPAAYAAEPTLPSPRGWPFPEAFPRTSGTGRLAGGALFWTDFLYDDHGARGVGASFAGSSLAPAAGTYTYASPKAVGNGADIFRAAVGGDSSATYWRVDWVSLPDPDLPIAEWTIDSDDNAATGVARWGAGAGVASPGIDHALVVSSRGAWLDNLLTGRQVRLPVTVDRAARSFVVRVPRHDLPATGTGRIRLASGVATADGTGFSPVGTADGAAPGQPAVYNVTFRSVSQEAPGLGLDNFWLDADQAATLATGDVSKFSVAVDWAQLAARAETPEPLVYGYSARWYVTPLVLGQGVVASNGLDPSYLSRVQPYSVYVPRSYRPGTPAPLTWMLHSLGVNYNQYGVLSPRTIQVECENRRSICADTEGFGPGGWYFDTAEVDFWDVWHALARSFTLDAGRTVISGYSMGGFATYKLGLEYPDVFAGAMALAGPPTCEIRVYGSLRWGTPGHCASDGDTTPLVGNARWLPFVTDDGAADELVPVTGVIQQIHAFLAAGDRIDAELYPAEDHLAYAAQDAFDLAVSHIGHPAVISAPPTISYRWYPDLVSAALGLGPRSVYWITSLRARSRGPGTLAGIQAADGALPSGPVTTVDSYGADPTATPTPAVTVDQTWRTGAAPKAFPRLTLDLADVASLTIDTSRARLPHGMAVVTSDGPVTLTLSAPRRTFRLSGGKSQVSW